MSSAASISAAKKRRANQVQPPVAAISQQPQMQRPMTAPSLASLTPAQRQQFMLQQQQRAQQQLQMQQARPQAQQPQARPQAQQQQPQQARSQAQQQQQQQQQQPHAQKRAELAWPAPPIYLMKQMDTMLFQQSQSIDDIKNRLNCIESGYLSEAGLPVVSEFDLEQMKPALMADNDFVSGIVDNIMTNSNLSEIIEQIDVVQNENRELRELLHAQQKTMNEMNVMLLKLFSQSMNQSAPIAQTVPIAPIAQTVAIVAEVPVPLVSEVPVPLVSEVPVPLVSEVPVPLVSEVPVPLVSEVPVVLERDEPEDQDSNNENHIQLEVVESSTMQTVD
jgi:multidrug efflux pump subunit AcrA (membrane-fusion protein)